ncbi:MAG: helix-turn-helix domain-containing protein [Acidobacteriaceae bacterium]
MNPVRELLEDLKRGSGLSWRELARRAGTAHSALIDYAKGRHDPGFATLQRVAHAAGYDLVMEVRPRLTNPEIRTLEMHRAIATKIGADPEGTLAIARANLATARTADTNGNTTPYLDTWEALIEGPLDRLIRVMNSTDQAARDLRQASPFAGVLSDDDRLGVMMRTDGARLSSSSGRSLEEVRDELRTAILAGRELVRDGV